MKILAILTEEEFEREIEKIYDADISKEVYFVDFFCGLIITCGLWKIVEIVYWIISFICLHVRII